MNNDKETQISDLYARYADEVWRSVRRHLGGVDDEVVSDACANGWMACLRSLSFDPSSMAERQAVAYIKIACQREGYTLASRETRESSTDAIAGFDVVAPEVDQDQLMDALASLGELSELQRKAVYAVHVIGLSYEQTMEALGWSYTQVNRHVKEGMKRIRDNREGGEQ